MTAPTSRTPRWIMVVLLLSQALHLAVAGLVAGIILRGGPPHVETAANLSLQGFGQLHRAMPEPDRQALRTDLRARGDTLRDQRRQMRETREQFLAALTAEPYSEVELRQILETQAGTWQVLSSETRDILVTRISAMTPEARATFAENLTKALRHKGPPRGKPRD